MNLGTIRTLIVLVNQPQLRLMGWFTASMDRGRLDSLEGVGEGEDNRESSVYDPPDDHDVLKDDNSEGINLEEERQDYGDGGLGGMN